MVDKDLLTAKLLELADRVAQVRRHLPETAEELGADRDALDIVSFNLMLAVQACADIASTRSRVPPRYVDQRHVATTLPSLP